MPALDPSGEGKAGLNDWASVEGFFIHTGYLYRKEVEHFDLFTQRPVGQLGQPVVDLETVAAFSQ